MIRLVRRGYCTEDGTSGTCIAGHRVGTEVPSGFLFAPPRAASRGLRGRRVSPADWLAHPKLARTAIPRDAPGRGHRVDNVLGVAPGARNSWISSLPGQAPGPYGLSCPKGRP